MISLYIAVGSSLATAIIIGFAMWFCGDLEILDSEGDE